MTFSRRVRGEERTENTAGDDNTTFRSGLLGEAKEISSDYQQARWQKNGSAENGVQEICIYGSYDPPPDGGFQAWLVLIERYGFHIVTIGGSVFLPVGLLTAGFWKTVPTLLITQGAITGLGAGAMFIPANTAQWLSKRRSLTLGISSSGSELGGIPWAFVLRTIIARLGYQWALWISAAAAALLSLTSPLFFKVQINPSIVPQKYIWSGLKLFKDPKFVALYY
ncbi:hypothetical protein M422DRAFT_238860 [Sphaerobolus stellatus SS14]|nr:hypothetical protein M422DRAFT_238860 [Sphaerobolus stellatus SS14]